MIDASGAVVAVGATSPITVTGLSNGVTYTFTVKAINNAGSSLASAVSNAVTPALPSGGGSGTPVQPTTPAAPQTAGIVVDILVNGKVESAGTATTAQVNGQTATTVVIDQRKLEDRLAAEGQNSIITIPITTNTDIVVAELTGQMIKGIEQKQVILEIKTDKATYTLPAEQININTISEQLGRNMDLQDIRIRIEIAAPTAAVAAIVANSALLHLR